MSETAMTRPADAEWILTSRQGRRLAAMRETWAEARELARSDPAGAGQLYREVNNDGMQLPAYPRRICVLDGVPALGHARVPGSAWEDDLAIGHGYGTALVTALDRWEGGEHNGGLPPERVRLPVGRASGDKLVARLGAVAAVLGLRPGDLLDVEYADNATVIIRRAERAPDSERGPE